jgi:hypothetical protein
VPRRSDPTTLERASSLEALTSSERSAVLAWLLREHPELVVDAERFAAEILSKPSVERVAADVESAVIGIELDALGARVGHDRGRGYVNETDAAWELIEEAIAPFQSDLERRATLGHLEAATKLVGGIVAGLYRLREPDMGTVVAYAGEEFAAELAGVVVELAERLGVTIPDDAGAAHWPAWIDLV